jgi:hypothetical protein
MSLVSEALRKARARAADGAAAPPTVPPTLVLPPRRFRSGIGLVPLLLVAVAAAVGGAAGVWWAFGRHEATPAPPAPAAAPAPAAGGSAPPGEGEGGAADLAAAGAGRAPAGAPAPSGTAPAPAGGDGSAAPTGAAPPAARETAAAAGPAAGEQAADQAAVVPIERSTREALIDADLGYAKLHLDYLVYRPGSPFGRVNGQDVIVGSTVDGFRVDEITADYIKVSDRRTVVILRVR